MSATCGRLSVGFVVRDGEDFDDVVDELDEVIGSAVRDWYERRGKDVLACEPT